MSFGVLQSVTTQHLCAIFGAFRMRDRAKKGETKHTLSSLSCPMFQLLSQRWTSTTFPSLLLQSCLFDRWTELHWRHLKCETGAYLCTSNVPGISQCVLCTGSAIICSHCCSLHIYVSGFDNIMLLFCHAERKRMCQVLWTKMLCYIRGHNFSCRIV